ncbi:MAG: HlyD family secretion protein [Luteibaculaceae bacterium]|jgi:HlyD family secretion protein
MKKKSGNKKWIWIAVGAVVLIIVIKALSGGNSDDLKVTVSPVSEVTIVEEVTANGKLQPADDVKISPEISGEITKLVVKEGQFVNKGDLLVKINPEIYEAALNRLESALNSSKANLANSRARLTQVKAQFETANSTHNRNIALLKGEVISDSEFESSLQQFLVAKAEIEASKQSINSAEFSVMSAQASLKEGLENLKRTTIYAPKQGTISALNVEQGERVVGTAQMAGTEMLRISSLDQMEVHVEVSENDIVRVNMGDEANVEVDAFPNMKFKGEVVEIANSASVVGMSADQVTNFAVKILVKPASYADLAKKHNGEPFRPGMSATVDIITERQENVLGVPIEAVTVRTDTSSTLSYAKVESKDDQEPIECVFVMDNGQAKLVPIKSGIQDRENIQILSGLTDGQEIITGPFSAISRTLRNGKKVQVVKKSQLFEKD